MDEKLFEILSGSGQVTQQKLLDYLQGKLSPAESHEIEKLLADSEFMNDAAEGLEQIRNKEELPVVLNELNRHLVKKLSTKRRKMLKRGLPDLLIPVVATILILIVILMIYYLVTSHLASR
jgi:anti-sigma factor RsiW